MAKIPSKRCRHCGRSVEACGELDSQDYCARCVGEAPILGLRRVSPSQADRIMHGGVAGGRGNVNGPRRVHLHGTVMFDGKEYELNGYLTRTEG